MDKDAIAIARREVLDLDHPDAEVRRAAIATLSHAVHRMELADPASGERCARLTYVNGRLAERYVDTAAHA